MKLKGSIPHNERKFEGTTRIQKAMYWLIALVLGAIISWWRPFYLPEHLYAICSKSNNIYTVDTNDTRAQCIVIRDDIIALVSSSRNSVLQNFPNINITDLPPEYAIYPGFADAHAHVLEYGFKQQLDLQGSDSVSEVIRRIRSFIYQRPDVLHNISFFIAGMGWDQTRWDGNFPTAGLLDNDPLLKGRPIALKRVDGHAAWISSRLLELMSPLPDTMDGGQIVRDTTGQPTGVFLDNAMELIPYPPWSASQYTEYFKTAMRDAISVGLTSIHDAFTSPEQVEFYKRMADSGELPLRLYLMGGVLSDKYWSWQFKKMHNYGVDGRLTLRSIKLMADGALGSWGAAMTEPYSDNPSTKGTLLQSGTVLEFLIRSFFKDGWQVNTHCIGDYANHIILNILEKMLSNYDVQETRPRIEHAQILNVSDIDRLGQLGVIASVQPTHATTDMWYAEKRLGHARMAGAYAYKSLLLANSSKLIAFGSDFPIEGINPLLGFYAAVTRLSIDGKSPHGEGGWYPHEKMLRRDALFAMTMGAAYASFAETLIGSLEAGKKADFVILDGDIMSVPVNEILKCNVKTVVVDGKFVL